MIEYGGMLIITLYGAKKLPAKDFNGTSDPFFIFSIGKQKIKSIVIFKSLSPYYGKEKLNICIQGKESLKIDCWDHNFIQKTCAS